MKNPFSYLFFSFLVFSSCSVLAQTGSVAGVVNDATTQEALIGVQVRIKDSSSGAITDIDGKYLLQLPVGVYQIEFSYLGYQTFVATDVIVSVNRVRTLNISLQFQTFEGEQAVITAGFFQRLDRGAISSTSFNPEEIRRSPGAAQEVSRILNAIPGVASAGDMSQDLWVRGGSPVENGFIIDNIPMPGIAHFADQGGQSVGPIGIVNTELVSNLEFFTGGFSAAYGDRMSSIGNIQYRDGNRKQFQGDLMMSLAGFGVNLEDGFAKEKGSYLVSFRRSYLDLIAEAINTGGAPRYEDFQSKIVYDLNSTNKLTWLSIYGRSRFRQSEKDAIENDFDDLVDANFEQITTGLNLRTLWGTQGFSNTSLSFSWKREQTGVVNYLSNQPETDFNVNDYIFALRNVNTWRISPTQVLEFGTDTRFELNSYDYFFAGGTNQAGVVRPDFNRTDDIDAFVAALFGQYTYDISSAWTISTGLRATFNTYNNQVYVDPRVTSKYALNPKLSLTASWGMYHQTPPRYLLSQNVVIRDIAHPYVMQSILGAEYMLTPSTMLRIEAFDKQYRNAPQQLLDQNNGIPAYVFDRAMMFFEQLNAQGRAESRGVEVFVQKKLAEQFYGLISATYMVSRFEDFNGNWVNRDFDTRGIFTVIGGYRPNKNWELSARFTYISGRPTTPIDVLASTQEGFELRDMSRFNQQRLPAYHSLFIRMDRRLYFGKTSFTTFIELWNAYNRANLIERRWNNNTGQIVNINQFSFLPVGGFKFEF